VLSNQLILGAAVLQHQSLGKGSGSGSLAGSSHHKIQEATKKHDRGPTGKGSTSNINYNS
jgi:hypothetical protein